MYRSSAQRHGRPEGGVWQEGGLANDGDSEGDGGEDGGVGGRPGRVQRPGLQAHDAHRLSGARLLLLHNSPEKMSAKLEYHT